MTNSELQEQLRQRAARIVVLTEVPAEPFDGIGVTDDYSAYQSPFTEHQLCWAHFLRKAIVLPLRKPENGTIRVQARTRFDPSGNDRSRSTACIRLWRLKPRPDCTSF